MTKFARVFRSCFIRCLGDQCATLLLVSRVFFSFSSFPALLVVSYIVACLVCVCVLIGAHAKRNSVAFDSGLLFSLLPHCV